MQHWSNYWKNGFLTSLPQDFEENYDGELERFWINSFSNLREKSTVYDLCTGNGAIAFLAGKYSVENKKKLNIVGVDAANINLDSILLNRPNLSRYSKDVSLIGNTKIEELKLQDESVDMFVSQYGIEYGHWDSIARKISQLLKPSGKLIFVSHAPNTDIMSYMLIEQKNYSKMADLGLFRLLDSFEKKSISSEKFLLESRTIRPRIEKEHEDNRNPIVSSFLDMIRYVYQLNTNQLDSEQDKIFGFYNQHRFAYARLEDIINVSIKIKSYPHWTDIFEQHGLERTRQGEIMQGGRHNAGLYYEFQKNTNPKKQ